MRRIVLLLFVLVFVNAFETENRIKRYEDTYHTKQQIGKPMMQKSRLTHCRDTIALIYEDFEAGMPTDWTVIDGNNDGHTWTTGTTFDLLYVHPPNYGTAYAYYSDDDAGSSAPVGTEYLISPSVRCAGATTMTLSHSWGHNQMGLDSYGTTQARLHDGISWSNWNTVATYPYTGNGIDTFQLDTYLPAESVQVQFTYEDPFGEWSIAFGVDNVLLEADIPIEYVWDFETGWQGWTHTNGFPFPMGWGIQPSQMYPISTPPDAGDSCVWIDDEVSGTFTTSDTALSPIIVPPPYMQWLVYGYCNYGGSGGAINDLYVGIKHQVNGTWNVNELRHYPHDTISGPAWDSILISSYATADSLQVYFYFTDNNTWAYWACFDNVGLYSVFPHDVGCAAVSSPKAGPVLPGNHHVIGEIRNFGTNNETFNVVANVCDTTGWNQLFTQTVNLTLAAGVDTYIDFGEINLYPNAFFYTEIYTLLAADENTANDTSSAHSRTVLSMGDVVFTLNAEQSCFDNQLFGIEFDGTRFYLTGGNSGADPNKVYILDTAGVLQWALDQPAHSTGFGWRDMAWDNVYSGPDRIDTLYASCNANVDRFGVDLISGALNYYGTLPGPANPNWSLAYMPESLFFFTADLNLIYKFIKNGTYVQWTPTPWFMYGAAYDSDPNQGDRVWWSSSDITGLQFKQFNPHTMSFTDTNFGCDFPSAGLCYCHGYRCADMLFAIVNASQGDMIYGFFLRWSDSTYITETLSRVQPHILGFGSNIPSVVRLRAILTYSIETPGEVMLEIYESSGRLVKTIIEDRPAPGTYTACWNGYNDRNQRVANGIYFVKLTHETCYDIKKIVFLR
jgi:hypothetical protein